MSGPEEATAPDLDAVSDAVGKDPASSAIPRTEAPRTQAPSPEVAQVPLASRMPGAAGDDYSRLPTAPVVTSATGPDADAPAWEPSEAAAAEPRAAIAGWAFGLAVLALVTSFFVGWMLPLGVVAVIAAIVALRRLGESRPLAIWALVLGAAAVVYSAGWLVWAIPQLPA